MVGKRNSLIDRATGVRRNRTDIARTPYHDAWDKIFYEPFNVECNSRLASLFPDPDFDELYEFSSLHKRVLRLEDGSVDSFDCVSILNDGDRFRRSPLFWAMWRGDQEMIELLLAQEACVDQLNHIGTSPLMLAAASADTASMEALLRAGADARLKNQLGATALHYVIQNSAQHRDSLNIIGSLLDAGSDPNGQCIVGTPLCIAANYGTSEQVELLINRGAKQSSSEKEGHNALSIATQLNRHAIMGALLEHGADHMGTLLDSRTFMHLVAQQANTASLQILLNHRLEARYINVKDKDGLTPLEVGFKREDVDTEWRDLFMQFLRSIDKNIPPQHREPPPPRAYSFQWPRDIPSSGRTEEADEALDNDTAVGSESSDDEFFDATNGKEVADSSQ